MWGVVQIWEVSEKNLLSEFCPFHKCCLRCCLKWKFHSGQIFVVLWSNLSQTGKPWTMWTHWTCDEQLWKFACVQECRCERHVRRCYGRCFWWLSALSSVLMTSSEPRRLSSMMIPMTTGNLPVYPFTGLYSSVRRQCVRRRRNIRRGSLLAQTRLQFDFKFLYRLRNFLISVGRDSVLLGKLVSRSTMTRISPNLRAKKPWERIPCVCAYFLKKKNHFWACAYIMEMETHAHARTRVLCLSLSLSHTHTHITRTCLCEAVSGVCTVTCLQVCSKNSCSLQTWVIDNW